MLSGTRVTFDVINVSYLALIWLNVSKTMRASEISKSHELRLKLLTNVLVPGIGLVSNDLSPVMNKPILLNLD